MKLHRLKSIIKPGTDSPPTLSQPVPVVDPKASLKVESIAIEEEEVPSEERNQRWFILGSIVAALVFLLSALFFVFLLKSPAKDTKQSIITEVEEVKEEKKEEKITFNRSGWAVEILNGSGVSGTASKVAVKLEGMGYQVLKVGNASRNDYSQSEISVSEDLTEEAILLIDDLKEVLVTATFTGTLSSSTASARIILGKQSVSN